jgi:plasmid stabilization system protein ParE
MRVRIYSSARRDLRRYRSDQELQKLERAFESISQNPMVGVPKHGALEGTRALDLNMPDGAHRIAYIFCREEQACVVFAVGPHDKAYERAQRRVRSMRKLGLL